MTRPDLPASAMNKVICAAFDGRKRSPDSLSKLCLGLIGEQRLTWPMLARAYQGLGQTLERTIRCSGFSVLVQRNPGRIASTTAPVNNGDTNGRPCFLCTANLPEEQRAILYRGRYLILPNPMPVLPFHCTVAWAGHEPQAISGKIDDFLRLMIDLGPDWTVLYNGPRCGASAPDHFHFQIVPSGKMPIEEEVCEGERHVSAGQVGGTAVFSPARLGRQAVIFEGRDPSSLGRAFDAFFESLKTVLCDPTEPMMNIVGFLKADHLCLVVFPRRKHRPAVFFKPGDERIVVSPAVVEMGGIFVTPVERDFGRLDASIVESIFDEVSLEGERVEAALRQMDELKKMPATGRNGGWRVVPPGGEDGRN